MNRCHQQTNVISTDNEQSHPNETPLAHPTKHSQPLTPRHSERMATDMIRYTPTSFRPSAAAAVRAEKSLINPLGYPRDSSAALPAVASVGVTLGGECGNLVDFARMRERRFYVYIMASPSGTLYVGVTNSIARRNSEHRNGLHPTSFTARYGCRKLVYYEEHGSIRVAIDREKQIKRWRREKKESLIRSINPGWQNLSHVWRE